MAFRIIVDMEIMFSQPTQTLPKCPTTTHPAQPRSQPEGARTKAIVAGILLRLYIQTY
jgi:hypothetical protein